MASPAWVASILQVPAFWYLTVVPWVPDTVHTPAPLDGASLKTTGLDRMGERPRGAYSNPLETGGSGLMTASLPAVGDAHPAADDGTLRWA